MVATTKVLHLEFFSVYIYIYTYIIIFLLFNLFQTHSFQCFFICLLFYFVLEYFIIIILFSKILQFSFCPHLSWAELKDLRLFLCTKISISLKYCSQICLNLCWWALLLCRDNPSTSQVWHIKMLIRQYDYCTGVP